MLFYVFVWEKGKTEDFSETIVVYDIKVGRRSQLNEYMSLYECQCHMTKTAAMPIYSKNLKTSFPETKGR